MLSVSKFYAFALCVGLGLVGSVRPAAAQLDSNRPRINTADPIALSGKAGDTIPIRPGETLHYVVTGNDLDLPVNGAPVPDRMFAIRPVVVRSMRPGTIQFVKRSIGADGTATYDVTGKAADAPGLYIDSFVAFDNRAGNDPRKDVPFAFTQAVLIQANATAQGAEPFVPAPHAAKDPAVSSRDRTTRERLSVGLRSQIARFLRRARGVTRENGATIVPVSAMPAALQQTANDYVQRIRSGAVGTSITEPVNQTSYRLVLLPAPYSAIGIDARSTSGSGIHY